jgi:hypothetical protein
MAIWVQERYLGLLEAVLTGSASVRRLQSRLLYRGPRSVILGKFIVLFGSSAIRRSQHGHDFPHRGL